MNKSILVLLMMCASIHTQDKPSILTDRTSDELRTPIDNNHVNCTLSCKIEQAWRRASLPQKCLYVGCTTVTVLVANSVLERIIGK